jgi:uncharacterized membrane protein YfcA
MLSPTIIIVFVVAVAVAAFVQSVTGFGFALLVAPVAAVLVGPRSGIFLITIVGTIVPITLVATLRRFLHPSFVGRVMIGVVVGAPLGFIVLNTLPESVIKILIAVAVLAAVAVLWSGPQLHQAGSALDIGGGFVSGALATSTGTNGPPIVLVLQARGYEPDDFRATLSACFVLINSGVTVLFFATGRADTEVLPLVLWSLPMLAVGWWIGVKVRTRIPPERFRHIALGLLGLAAAVSVVSVFV